MFQFGKIIGVILSKYDVTMENYASIKMILCKNILNIPNVCSKLLSEKAVYKSVRCNAIFLISDRPLVRTLSSPIAG